MSIHIGNLHRDTHKGDLDRVFSRYGRIRSMWLARSPPGFAFVEFEDVRDAKDAIHDMDGREILGNRVRVQMKKGGSGESADFNHSRKPTRSEHRVIISGLATDATWKDLKGLLKEKTDPVYVDFRGEGKAVAEFANEGDVAVAIENFGGIEFKGSSINIMKDEKGGDERSDSWQKFDTRPKGVGRSRGGIKERFDRSRSRDRRRDRSRSRSRSRGRRHHDDRRRGNDNYRGGYDRSRNEERSRDRGRDGRR